MKKQINFQLSEIAEGGLQEKFDHEIKRVIDNILNPNTDAKRKRKVNITISLTPSENRDTVNIDTEVKSTLVPENGVSTTLLVGRDAKQQLAANELKSGTPGQTFIGDDGDLKTDTGESVASVEKDVIDFQKQKKAGN